MGRNKETHRNHLIYGILFSAAIVFLAAGILLQDTVVIFRKAVFICMECMGLA